MCGIIGAIAERDVVPILVAGLKKLEYRGYDSAGLVVLDERGSLHRVRAPGKVVALQAKLENRHFAGHIGLAHTRWATHGGPCEKNAHPHIGANKVAVVHNGIIENEQELRQQLIQKGYLFESETDTEVAAVLMADILQKTPDILTAILQLVSYLEGAYALCILDFHCPDSLWAIRHKSPLVLGIGADESFVASDVQALYGLADRFIYLEEGDIACIQKQKIMIWNLKGEPVDRTLHEMGNLSQCVDKGHFAHYMLKEIYEQPAILQNTLLHQQTAELPIPADIWSSLASIQIVGCGTSYYAGMVARYWFEEIAGIPTQVEIASEFRYRKRAHYPQSLLICLSQSGETADTLAALKGIQPDEYLGCLSICNVARSSLMRESDWTIQTLAGPEIGVCSTKAFTCQLACLLWLAELLCSLRQGGALPKRQIGNLAMSFLGLEQAIAGILPELVHKQHALFLGRGVMYPIALEAALKLKELSYIHAEAYPAGELKHGPLALVDENMPVVVLAPQGPLLPKIKSSIQEVRSRGGQLIVFAPSSAQIQEDTGIRVVIMPEVDMRLAPILYSIPLQILAYRVALAMGTDVDQPRNLAKSVTVE